jgi:hypothetical protein
MNRSIYRIAIFLLAAFLAPALIAGTIRIVDFESPATFDTPWEHVWEEYSGYEATFEYGIRRLPLDGYTTSTMYWGGPGWCSNCDYGPIRIYFDKPVKNIHFTLYNFFGPYLGPINSDTREFFTDPPRSVMYVSPPMATRESRIITVPGEHVRYLEIATNNAVGLDDFSFEVEDDVQNPVTYRLDLTESTDPGFPVVDAQTITPGTDINAQLALGTIFSVGVSKRTPDPSGGPATITSIASTYTKSADKVLPALETDVNLFPDSPVVQLAPDPTSGVTELKFAAVHLGNVKFTLTPLASGAPASVTLNLAIIRPSFLGGEHNDWDNAVVDAAHERGIPPQVIKGQIRQESPTFNQNEFRYEPCSEDFANISRGLTLIKKAPYNLYAMDTALSDADLADTVDLRSQLYILDPTSPDGRRHIVHTDTGVTARAIWDASDLWNGHGQKWSKQTCRALDNFIKAGHVFADFLNELDQFIAQTPTASSYGVMQALYSTALAYQWSVDDPMKPGQQTQNPRYLRDSTEALQLKHGGSIWVGGHEDVQRYWDEHNPNLTAFPSQEDFFDSFKTPLFHYTGGGASQKNYGVNIIDKWQYDYLPIEPTLIFN